MRTQPLTVGEPTPWFSARTKVNPTFKFDTMAGRYVVLSFFGSAADPAIRQALAEVHADGGRFDDDNFCFFGVGTDPADEREERVRERAPGIRVFWDFDFAVSGLFGATREDPEGTIGAVEYHRVTYVLDPRLRVMAVFPYGERAEGHFARVLDYLAALPPLGGAEPGGVPAPVLVVPRVFEPELCRTLIDYYERRGGEESGFMRDVGGKTVEVFDYNHKRRRDQVIEDEELRRATMFRIHDRLAPEIHKAFQFRATRIERYIVACYEAESSGHFRPHRDNTTKGTAHRRFAVSLNLNTGEYEGGDLRFPEFGRQLYTPPAGGAVVFSCSLLHEATPVRSGRRYVFLPFLYDDAAAKIRDQNQRFVSADRPAPPG
jgi:peroxiredoxin/predicted 2-oxoglutarate/Fe(II)-dependent dioxygenase YbiX